MSSESWLFFASLILGLIGVYLGGVLMQNCIFAALNKHGSWQHSNREQERIVGRVERKDWPK